MEFVLLVYFGNLSQWFDNALFSRFLLASLLSDVVQVGGLLRYFIQYYKCVCAFCVVCFVRYRPNGYYNSMFCICARVCNCICSLLLLPSSPSSTSLTSSSNRTQLLFVCWRGFYCLFCIQFNKALAESYCVPSPLLLSNWILHIISIKTPSMWI